MKNIPLDFYVKYFIFGELVRTWGFLRHRTAFRETASFKLSSLKEMEIKVFKCNSYWFFGKKRPTVTENIHWNYGIRSGAILKGVQVFICILQPWVPNCAQNLKGSWIVVWLWRDQFLTLSPDFKILCRLNMMHKRCNCNWQSNFLKADFRLVMQVSEGYSLFGPKLS